MDVRIKCEIVLDEDSVRLIPLNGKGERLMEDQFGIPRDGEPGWLEEVLARLPKWIKTRFLDDVGRALNRAKVT